MEARGKRNHNPLNIRKGNNWQGEDHTRYDSEFEVFISDEYGFRAAFRIIKNGFNAKPPRDTIRKIVTRWAPPTENNTEMYIKTVSRRAMIDADTRLNYSDMGHMVAVVKAMAYVETGHDYDEEKIRMGYHLEQCKNMSSL